MKTHGSDYKETVLINYPTEVTVREVEDFLSKNTKAGKKRLIYVIFHRLNNRYVRPINKIPSPQKSGFLTMAAACLLIEALQAFREGKEYTARGASVGTFKKFFSENKAFGHLVPFSGEFYTNVRCGILHQAETYGNWLIIRKEGEPLFNPKRKAIQADVFLRELSLGLRSYFRELSQADWDDPLWKAARSKLMIICEHCKGTAPNMKPEWIYYI